MVDIRKITGPISVVAGTMADGVQDQHQRMLDRKLGSAIKYGNHPKFISALGQGANPNAIITDKYPPYKHSNICTALEFAARKDRWNMVEHLVRHCKVDVEQRFSNKETVLLRTAHNLNSKKAVKCFEFLLKHGASPHAVGDTTTAKPTVLFSLVAAAPGLDFVKPVLKQGVDLTITNKDGKTAEEYAKGFGYLESGSAADMIRVHRLAPIVDVQFMTLEDLTVQNEQGYCALDHWETWDQYKDVAASLGMRGMRLRASQLLKPMEGFEDEQGKPRARIEVMLGCCPSLKEHLFDRELWRGESQSVLRAFMEKLPQDIRDAAPHHQLAATLRREENLVRRTQR